MKKIFSNLRLSRSRVILSSIHFLLVNSLFSGNAQKSEDFLYYPNDNITETNKTMSKTHLETFVKLDSIGAASGIVFHEKNLYIISDNSGFLSKYNIETKEIKQFGLIENPTFNIAKKIKPDFESITLFQNKICIYGSGSTSKRQDVISFDINSHKVTTESMKGYYERFQLAAGLTEEEFNIEGVFYYKNYEYYCQRGNKSANKNCLFRFDKTTEEVDVFYFILPKIAGINATFTDAILIDQNIYFLASAENTNSTYNDGEIMGSVFGKINVETMKVEHKEVISTKNKFEGITLFKETKDKIHFLLCEDNDTESLESEIFELTYFK